MFKKAKKKIKPVPAPAFALGAPRVRHGYAEIFDQASGRTDGPIYNIACCPLESEIWLFRTHRADPFQLVMRFGDNWFEMGSVRADDPAVQSLFDAGHIVEYGPTPAQIETQRAREAEERERLEEEQEYHRARKEHRLHLQRQAEARESRARAEIQAGM